MALLCAHILAACQIVSMQTIRRNSVEIWCRHYTHIVGFLLIENVFRYKVYSPYSLCETSIISYRVLPMICNTSGFNTLRPRQNGRRFADDSFKRIFLNENVRITIKISVQFVPKGPINNIPALVQIMAWRRSGNKPLSDSLMFSLLTHIWVTRPQWVNIRYCRYLPHLWWKYLVPRIQKQFHLWNGHAQRKVSLGDSKHNW